MVAVIKRVPPPPPIAVNDPVFNRWLHDLTSFIGSQGIDTSQIPGWDQLIADVTTHTAEIADNTTDIATNATNIATNTINIATNTTNITTLTTRSQVRNGTAAPTAGLGVNGDWFADTVAKHIHVKVAGAWVQIV